MTQILEYIKDELFKFICFVFLYDDQLFGTGGD